MILEYQFFKWRGVYNYDIAFQCNKYINISLKTMILLKVILRFEKMILEYQKIRNWKIRTKNHIDSYVLSPISIR